MGRGHAPQLPDRLPDEQVLPEVRVVELERDRDEEADERGREHERVADRRRKGGACRMGGGGRLLDGRGRGCGSGASGTPAGSGHSGTDGTFPHACTLARPARRPALSDDPCASRSSPSATRFWRAATWTPTSFFRSEED